MGSSSTTTINGTYPGTGNNKVNDNIIFIVPNVCVSMSLPVSLLTNDLVYLSLFRLARFYATIHYYYYVSLLYNFTMLSRKS